nr:histidine kinase [uncultured Duganella sp.]
MKHWGKRVAIAALAWTAIGAVFALPYMMRGQWYHMATMINWWLWGPLAPLISAVDDRLQAACERPLPLLAAHAGFGVLLTALYVGTAATLEYALGLNAWAPGAEPQFLFDWFVWALIVYCLILGTLKAFKYYRRHIADELQLERLERRVLETRLNALRLQLDPQLVFDALEGISACVERQPKLARKMIEHLGDLLRFSLATRNRRQVTLAEEMSFLENYFALQRLHFEERLAVTLAVMPDVAQARIPPLLLQPLAENAIRHGVAGRAGGGRVTVSARRAGAMLEIRVADDGPGPAPHWRMETSPGLGLSVTRERLSAMYPAGESGFAVARGEAGGTEAVITLPLTMVEEDRHAHVFV